MNLSTALMLMGAAYGILYFFDSFFKSCAHYPYIKFLEGTGFQIKIFSIQWTTTAFNRSFLRIGSIRSKSLNLWYTFGLWISLALLPISICLLFVSLFQHFVDTKSSKILAPAVPGISLPASELGYYSFCLMACSLFHELGHALAAVKEDVHIVNVGFTIFFCLPVAYVNLNAENFKTIEPWKRLKILCAGVWHNIVLALICYFTYLSLPYIFSGIFTIGKGVTVYHARNSPLFGPRGFEIGDIVTKINGCKVKNEDNWFKCLNNVPINRGVCLHSDLARNLDESVSLRHLENGMFECCDSAKPENVCFESQDNEVLEFPSHVCLPARKVLTSGRYFCDGKCPDDLRCFKPMLNDSHLFNVEIFDRPNVVYVGRVSDFTRTLRASSFVPKFILSTPFFPEMVKKLLEYFVMFSFGLAVVNVLPCMFMDGQHIANVLMYVTFGKKLRSETIVLISHTISFSFTVLLFIYCGLSLTSFLY